ncbi:hypothetical protein FQN60_011041 [Etheostoma spectabile]|uniref:Murine leukemia virus integrase C-terminal domain-containing protein n=1 Tax=Etheostoma spectabile TaxID=54343 RepID=A0A5J5DR09_9PERO|nr:hypothetical protein FQN60_011041 [Etheostoma spectabile]
MKRRYDQRAVERTFQPGDRVLMLTPTSSPALTARFTGLYVVKEKVKDYIIYTPGRRRLSRLCHGASSLSSEILWQLKLAQPMRIQLLPQEQS